MINLEHKLTIDDLIVTYLIKKTKKGYIPEVTEEEFLDFIKYLLEDDLATKIELKSIKEEIINFYKEFSKISSYLLSNDPNLVISSYNNPFLPYSNYELIIDNKECNLLKNFCNTYGNGIKINYPKSSISIQVPSSSATFYKEDEKYNITKINFKESKHAKKLVKMIK